MLNLIKASAGSGKTYALTLEYITLLLGERDGSGEMRLVAEGDDEFPLNRHRCILAVTFTNAATNEMKQRIIDELIALSDSDGKSKYMAELTVRLNASEEEVNKASARALRELLVDYARFNISTIDTFFQTVLRTFSAEADVPFEYDVEVDEKMALKIGVSDFLSYMRANEREYGPVLKWLSEYVRDKAKDSAGSWNLFSTSIGLASVAEELQSEKFRKLHTQMEEYLVPKKGDALLGEFSKDVRRRYSIARQEFIAMMRRADRLIEGSQIAQYRSNGSCPGFYIRKALSSSFRFEVEKGFYESFERAVGRGTSNFARSKLKGADRIEEARQVDEQVRDLCLSSLEQYSKLTFYGSLSGSLYNLGLLGHISRFVYDYCEQNNMVLLADTNQLLSDIITEQDTPFIYERVGTRVDNFLIDEFQDTSRMQWGNLAPLLSNSLANGHENLIIGDVKQSIYRFRNSDPELLHSCVEATFGSQIGQLSAHSRNWRSAPNIIRFNNTIFSYLASVSNVDDYYANVVQLTNNKPRNGDGLVNIYLVKKNRSQKDAGEGDDKTPAKSIELRVADLICDMIDRGYRQHDIALLCNRRIEGTEMINALLEYNNSPQCRNKIEVISTESLLLKQSPSVRLIISHLRYLAAADAFGRSGDEDDEEERTPQRKNSNENKHRVLRQYERLCNSGLTSEEALEECFTNPDTVDASLADTRSLTHDPSGTSNVGSVVERIIETSISPEARQSENSFITAFQDCVYEYCERDCATLTGLLRWWDDHCDSLSIQSPGDVDAVSVMTIHKSKGLEFPCVIIPYATWDMLKPEGRIWATREMMVRSGMFKGLDENAIPPLTPIYAEKVLDKSSPVLEPYNEACIESAIDNLNKTYVAFTRAIDELHIFTEEVNPDARTTSSHVTNLSDCISQYIAWQTEENVMQIESSYAAEIGDSNSSPVTATMDVFTDPDTEEQYCSLGQPADQHGLEREPMLPTEPMPPYYVHNSHSLARFVLPELFLTPQQEHGITLHRIMSQIRNRDDVDRVILKWRSRYVLEESKLDEAEEIVRSVINQSDEVRSWFDPANQVYNERTILTGRQHFRPDRIVVTPAGETIVIDYKFGEPNAQSHTNQVQNYMNLLSQAGFKRITGCVWYPLTGLITHVG